MQRLRHLYEQLPKRLRKWLEIVGVLLGLLVLVILSEFAKDGALIAGILFIGISVLVVGYEPAQKWRAQQQARKDRRQREEWVRSQLGKQSWEDALASAHYEYDRWPDGDNNYLIWDKRIGEVVAQVWSPEDAELWILEQTLSKIN